MATFFRWVGMSVFFLSTPSLLAETPDSKPFQYRVRIPATSLTCEQEAALLAQKFTRATSLQADQSQCREVLTVTFDKKSYQLYSLVLTYTAEESLTPYTARFGTAGQLGTPQGLVGGLYSTFEECLKDSSVKKPLFEQHTLLPVVSAVCEIAPFGRPFQLRIDSFGKPAKTLHAFHSNYRGSPEINRHIAALIEQSGGIPVHQVDASWLYFSPSPLSFLSHDFGNFDTDEQCKTQLADASAILMNSGSRFVYAECVSMHRLQAIGDGNAWITNDYGTPSEAYYSLSECLNDKNRVLADRRTTGKTPLGAICSHDFSHKDVYRVVVYDAI